MNFEFFPKGERIKVGTGLGHVFYYDYQNGPIKSYFDVTLKCEGIPRFPRTRFLAYEFLGENIL